MTDTTPPTTPTRRPTCATCGQRADAEEINGDLLRELRLTVALLETLEWTPTHSPTMEVCPKCDACRWQGHADGCGLAARLNGARAAIEKATEGGAE